MPQSIYQGLTYIGETLQNYVPPWRKNPWWNWVEGNWVQLNADIGKVDFAVRNVTHDRAMIVIYDHLNFDYLDYTMTVTGPGLAGTPISLPDNTESTWITGLTPSSNYTVTLIANLISGGTTLPSTQTFRTSANVPPLAPTNLTSPARTNAWIDLKWTHPAGSSAVKSNVYFGVQNGPVSGIKTTTGTTIRITGLRADTKYWYYVRGVNSTGLEGPASNQLRWATGHEEIRRKGSDDHIMWKPDEWGSYRPDIKWKWARESGVKDKNPHLYQGYWPGNNWHGASNPASNPAAGKERRYWGVVTYDRSDIIAALDKKHGSGVGNAVVINKMVFAALYRHTNPGKVDAQSMEWHMTNANPFNSGQPPTYKSYDGKSMRQGEKIENYKLPAEWGTYLIDGKYGGTTVNGLCLNRMDNQTNGYGAAGYGRWSGHLLVDPDHSKDSWRKSDLTLVMSGSWDYTVTAYKGPYQW